MEQLTVIVTGRLQSPERAPSGTKLGVTHIVAESILTTVLAGWTAAQGRGARSFTICIQPAEKHTKIMTPLKNKLEISSIQWSTISETEWIFGRFQSLALVRFS